MLHKSLRKVVNVQGTSKNCLFDWKPLYRIEILFVVSLIFEGADLVLVRSFERRKRWTGNYRSG